MNAQKTTAREILREAYGPEAQFRDGQVEAIKPLLAPGSRSLVVQKTGWGKSVVYFVATRLLRKDGRGPTLLVSPLLSLMRNQIDSASAFGLKALSLNSANQDDWEAIENSIAKNTADLLLISPERLANPDFRQRILPTIEANAGLLVIDEAHCISDWGHDFRPDYRRILTTVNRINPNASILATTATANDRVIEDIKHQLGDSLQTQRGPLMRESLKLSVFKMADQAERLAWLATYVPKLPGTGIIYALTVNDTMRVANWLRMHEINVEAYHAGLETEEKLALEQRFHANDLKALVATTALGMGYDKSDVRFVVHFQRPGSVINYYQQVGRAGRDGQTSFGILLEGVEDDEINDYFITSAFPDAACFDVVLQALDRPAKTLEAIVSRTNLRYGQVEKAVKLLEVEGVVERTDTGYIIQDARWTYEQLRSEQIVAQRRQEMQQMQDYVKHEGCRMEFLAKALDDAGADLCKRCDNCLPHADTHLEPSLIQDAIRFLRRDYQPIPPKRWYPAGAVGEGRKKIPEEELLLPGVALSVYGDAGWGRVVRDAKYGKNAFPDELIPPAIEAISKLALPPDWIAWVPSLNRENLVADFANRLAAKLNIEAIEAVKKVSQTRQQKEMQNSATQFANVRNAFDVSNVRDGVCLLVDDVIDSGWTMTAIGVLLLQKGSGPVMPFTLATSKPRGDA